MNSPYAWSPTAEPTSGTPTPARELPCDVASVAQLWAEHRLRRPASRRAGSGPDKLLTVEDVCAYVGVSKDFVYDEVRHGHLRAARIVRPLRFRPPDVDAFVDANAVAEVDL